MLNSDFSSAASAASGSDVDKAVKHLLCDGEAASLLRSGDKCAFDRFKMEQVRPYTLHFLDPLLHSPILSSMHSPILTHP